MWIKKLLCFISVSFFLFVHEQGHAQIINYSEALNSNKDTSLQSRTRILLMIIHSNFMTCADTGNYEMIEYMLKRGVNPNYSIENGVTPLMLAVDNGHYKISEILIEYGANVNSKPYDGNTAIFAAVKNNNDSIVELLVKNNTQINVKNDQNLTPLHYASGFGYPYLTSFLIEKGASINEKDLNGNTPIMCSVYAGANVSTDILIESGADVNLPDKDGNTPLMVAAQFNDTVLIEKLINAKADVRLKNKMQKDALTIAIENSSTEAFIKLFPFIDNSLYNNNLQRAKEFGSNKIVNYLSSKGIHSEFKFIIKGLNFYSGFSVSKTDFMLDFGTGIQEFSTNLIINLGYKYKPITNRVLVLRDNAYYQLWEKRYSIYLSVQYPIPFNQFNSYGQLGIIPGYSNELTWKYYRGFDAGSGLKYIPTPSLGIYFKKKSITAIGKWEFANYNKELVSANRFSLQLILTLSKRKLIKQINWLD